MFRFPNHPIPVLSLDGSPSAISWLHKPLVLWSLLSQCRLYLVRIPSEGMAFRESALLPLESNPLEEKESTGYAQPPNSRSTRSASSLSLKRGNAFN